MYPHVHVQTRTRPPKTLTTNNIFRVFIYGRFRVFVGKGSSSVLLGGNNTVVSPERRRARVNGSCYASEGPPEPSGDPVTSPL